MARRGWISQASWLSNSHFIVLQRHLESLLEFLSGIRGLQTPDLTLSQISAFICF